MGDGVNGGKRKNFPNNIHRAKYHFTHSKKTDNTTLLPLSGIVYREFFFKKKLEKHK
jgi:hypothetical protein